MTHEEKMAAILWAGAELTAPVYPAPDPEAPPSKHAGTWHAGPDGWKEWVEVGEQWLARHRVEKFVIDILGDGQAPMWALPPEYQHGVTVRRGWLYGQKATYVEGGGRSYLAAGWDTRLAVRDARRAWRRWAQEKIIIGED